MYKRSDLNRFSKEYLQTSLPSSYQIYKNGDLIRLRGPFLQLIACWVSRGGWIHFEPTFFVVGADLGNVSIHQSVSLSVLEPNKWKFPPSTELDKKLASNLLDKLNDSSPISFFMNLDDEVIEKGLRQFSKNGSHWAAAHFLAFFSMLRGEKSAHENLEIALRLFNKNSRVGSEKPLRDWEERLLARLHELFGRLHDIDCIPKCRKDAELHSKSLALPDISWPPEWPESMPP